MASITIELDFTKQGGGWRPEAVNLSPLPGLQKVTWLLEKFVDQQWTRFPRTTIRNLYVLVRRHHSFRLAAAELDINRQNPKRLRSLVDTLTITGATHAFAIEFILAMSGKSHPFYSEESRQMEINNNCTYCHPAREYPHPQPRPILDA
ncbi:hypothetical protein MMYC01_208455 [Madurella mycetomatis]|uniref:Uncharacterized protein n=1 Tax=Madurella mycetomatis TaxID=100816 RepID=A0A175VTW5_9PEZI|nr:hypothetical protein MMYC01_208455 [Madurella mycetomatis]